MKLIVQPFDTVTGADLREQNFQGADLAGVTFEDVNLDGVSFEGATLEGTQWRGVSLDSTNFKEANLEGADFFAVNARGAVFKDANLRNVKMTNVRLEEADLRGSDVRGADMDQVYLLKANIQPITSDGKFIRHISAEPYGASYTSDQLQIGCQNHPIAAWFSMTPEQMEPLGPEAVEQWEKWKDFLSLQILSKPCQPTRDVR